MENDDRTHLVFLYSLIYHEIDKVNVLMMLKRKNNFIILPTVKNYKYK